MLANLRHSIAVFLCKITYQHDLSSVTIQNGVLYHRCLSCWATAEVLPTRQTAPRYTKGANTAP